MGLILVGLQFFILFPLYVLSRVFNMSYVIICVLSSNWEDIAMLQLVLSCVYVCGLIIWFPICIKVITFYYHVWHILPGATYLYFSGTALLAINGEKKTAFEHMKDAYDSIVIAPVRRQAVIGALGPDIGPIVLGYLPQFALEYFLPINIETSDESV